MGEWLTIATLVGRIALMLIERAREKTDQGVGYMRAMKESLEQAHLDLARADAAQYEADEQHRKDPTDDAFDRRFERQDP